jgi:hypothetical protein
MALNLNPSIDDEWSKFISSSSNNNLQVSSSDDDEHSEEEQVNVNVMGVTNMNAEVTPKFNESETPEPSDIYISTKSKIAYLTEQIDLKIFWNIPIIPYATPSNGVIKKQMKFNSKTKEELEAIEEKLKDEKHYDQHIMSHIDNPNGRIKFKDIRKITVGISKKDIMSCRSKKKQAFYNCFVMIMRLKMDGVFKEFHIKVFNTGKLEIPGVQSDAMFECVLLNIISTLQPYVETQLSYKKTSDTVLINSNFNCGFYINREVLYDILKYKYKIQCIYDPCSYPGIQCKFYYDPNVGIQTGLMSSGNTNQDKTEVSFMIFRTGSVLIVGMCEECVLVEIYNFLKQMLKTEFVNICQKIINKDSCLKSKKKKIRRKMILVTNDEANHDEHVENDIEEADEDSDEDDV